MPFFLHWKRMLTRLYEKAIRALSLKKKKKKCTSFSLKRVVCAYTLRIVVPPGHSERLTRWRVSNFPKIVWVRGQ